MRWTCRAVSQTRKVGCVCNAPEWHPALEPLPAEVTSDCKRRQASGCGRLVNLVPGIGMRIVPRTYRAVFCKDTSGITSPWFGLLGSEGVT